MKMSFRSTWRRSLAALGLALAPASPAAAQGVLSIDVVVGHNLVVDSNVTAPSTYAPSAAYIAANYCNTGDANLTNVTAYVGNFAASTKNVTVTIAADGRSLTRTGGGNFDPATDGGLLVTGTGIPAGTWLSAVGSTTTATLSAAATPGAGIAITLASAPGIFPVTTFGTDLTRPHLSGTGPYSYTLEVGSGSLEDATRYIGTLTPGTCRIQYWLFSYPQCVNVNGAQQYPPCDVSIAGGVKPDDDLSLDYDVWGTATELGSPVSVTRDFTMRNEISAAANKIWPNTASKVPDEYLAAIQGVVGWGTLGPDGQPLTSTSAVYPGQRVITTQGIWYDLGNVVHGFDNDGDLIVDQNAWLQPVGDPGSFDTACFRMVNVYGIVIVKLKSGGELLIPFQNQLYHENLPDNTGVVGLVYYQYIATREGCSSNMTPYQEAASGYDNEKFAGDYGLNLGLQSGEFDTDLTFSKTDGVSSVAPGGTLTYTVSATNSTGVSLGAPDLGTPLVFRESIPSGTTYVANSADDALTTPSGTGSYQQGYTDRDGNLDTCTINYNITSSAWIPFYSTNGGFTWSLTDPGTTVTDLRWMLQTTIVLDGGHDRDDCIAPTMTPSYDDGTIETSLPPGKTASVAFQVTVNTNPDPVICNTARLGFGPALSNVTAQDCTLVTGPNSIRGTVWEDDGGDLTATYGNGTIDNTTEVGIDGGVQVSLYYDFNGDLAYDSGDLLYGTTSTVALSRSFSVGVTSGSATVTSAGNLFTAADVGRGISGTNIPAGAYITAVSSTGSATMSANATGTGSTTATLAGTRSITTTTTNGSTTVTSAGLFRATDVGSLITGTGIPAGAYITGFTSTSSVTISSAATAGGSASRTLRRPHYAFTGLPDGNFVVVVKKYDGSVAGNGTDDAATDFDDNRNGDSNADATTGWGTTTYDPNLPITTDTGILKLGEDLTTVSLAISIDLDHSYTGSSADQSQIAAGAILNQINFGFAPPFQLTKTVAVSTVDEGDLFDYTIVLENRLPSVGVQGPTGCQYTVWAPTGSNGSPGSKEFTDYLYALDGPNRRVAYTTVEGGGTDYITATGFRLADQAGSITRVEALVFGYFNTTLTDDYLVLEATLGANTITTTIPTAAIDSYVGEPADLRPDSAISWDMTAAMLAARGSAWSFADDFSALSIEVNPSKTANADAKTFNLDAVGIRVTTNADCEAGASTTLDPVPLQDRYDPTWMSFVSAVPPPTSVSGSTLQWNNVGPILPGTSNVVTVTMRANDVAGLETGSCAGVTTSIPPGTDSLCNLVQTAYGSNNVYYADGRLANDDDDMVPVNIQGKGELRGVVYRDTDNDGWPLVDPDNDNTRLPNVSVTLFTCVTTATGVQYASSGNNQYCTGTRSWVPLATTTTDATGAYEFIGLDNGYYIIQVGDTDSLVTTSGSSPFGFTQTAEPLDVQTATSGNANGADCGSCNNTWGNSAAELLANQSTINFLSGASEETINGINFGYFSTEALIYGNIWHDVDGDATRDTGDGDLDDFTVALYSDTDNNGTPDTLVETTSSDADGNYSFTVDILVTTSYVIVVTPETLPNNVWRETVETTGGTGSLNNQIPITVTPGSTSGSHDFGYTLDTTSAIGDRVWLDFDGDGLQDASELGIPDITVWLYGDVDRDGVIDAGVDELLDTDVTDSDGEYLFEGLAAGNYIVVVDTDDADFPAGATATADPDLHTGTIGDYVWLDADGGGDQDTAEGGLHNVVVFLWTDDGDGTFETNQDTLTAATATNVNGNYLFTGLPAGDYWVQIDESTLPESSLQLTSTSPTASMITLAAGDNVLTADAGYSPSSNYLLGNRVWHDEDGDKVQDAGEVGLPGIDVTVTGTGCSPCTATTDASGFWYVSGLSANTTYTVTVDTADLPRDFVSTISSTLTANRTNASATLTAAAGTFSTVDIGRIVTGTGIPADTYITAVSSDGTTATMSANATSGGTNFTLTRTGTWRVVTADRDTADFGYRYTTPASTPTGTISGSVFLDGDGDRALDSGEAISSVTVNLLDENGYVIATTTTNGSGAYSFPGVFIGDYAVEVLAEYGTRYSVLFLSSTAGFPNLNVIYDADATTTPDDQSSVAVDGVHDNLLQDFGYQRYLGSIGDTVYWDANENGTQDIGEPGIPGVTLNLYKCIWDSEADANGIFELGEGSSCALVPGVPTVTTTADDPLTAADEGGKYLFSNLEEIVDATPLVSSDDEYYVVVVNTASLPGTHGTNTYLTADPESDGLVCTELPDPDFTTPASVCDDRNLVITFTGGLNYLGADFGYQFTDYPGYGKIGDHVWVDTDGDGVRDAGEAGIPAITVWLDTDNDGVVDALEPQTETNSDGYYLFTGLADSSYRVRVLTSDPDWPTGLSTIPTYEVRETNNDSLDSMAVAQITGGVVAQIDDGDGDTTDTCSDCDLDVDFGYRYTGSYSLSGTVCLESETSGGTFGNCGATDTTYNGVASGTESALSGITVYLYLWNDAGTANQAWNGTTGVLDSGDTFTLIGSTSTGTNGDYSFSNVPPNVVVAFGVSPTQTLQLNTTNANTSAETPTSRQLWNGTQEYGIVGDTSDDITVVVRQALNLAGNTVDVDFAFAASELQAYDFGDLPDTAYSLDVKDYDGTLLSSGARHLVTGSSVYLGSSPTTEVDGKDSVNAALDQDEGVDLLSDVLYAGADGGGVQVEASGAGWLIGWMDFNNDGDFSDAGERIIDQAVSAGTNYVLFDVPAGPLGSDSLFARFRIYDSEPLLKSPRGPALDSNFAVIGGEVEDYLFALSVTATVVHSFTAREIGSGVALEWETASEVGTLGFFLRRLDPATNTAVVVNEKLIPAKPGKRQGSYYRHVDPGASSGVDLVYQLVEVEASGRELVYGPFTVNTAEPLPDAAIEARAALLDAEGEGDARVAKASEKTPERRPTATVRGGPRGRTEQLKLAITDDGIYFLSLAQMQALGLSVDKSWLMSHRNLYTLSVGGQPVAFTPTASADGILFYGQALDSIYTAENVYWMKPTVGLAPRMHVRKDLQARSVSGAETYPHTVKVEQQALEVGDLYRNPEADTFVWDAVVAGSYAPKFTFQTPGLRPTGPVTLRVRLKGASDTLMRPDHRAIVKVNGRVAGQSEFDGLDEHEFSLTVDAAFLVDGANTLQISGGATGASYSYFFVDSFDVTYPRVYRAQNNRIRAGASGNSAFQITGFTRSDIAVFDVTDPRFPTIVEARVARVADGTWGVTLSPSNPDAVYYAATPDTFRSPLRVLADAPSTLASDDRGAEYVVVAPVEFMTPAQRLATYRSDMSTMVVDLEDVYDEFGHGIATPYALRAFFEHAWKNWQQKPRFAVFAGDGSTDYKAQTGFDESLVPVKRIATPNGLVPSDAWFGEVDQEHLGPEVVIGRLPASSAAELDKMITKIQAREAAAGSAWTRKVVLAADNADKAGNFPADSDAMLGWTGPLTERNYLSNSNKVATARPKLIASFNNSGFISYLGHGGFDLLADEGLLRTRDVNVMTNGNHPVLTAMTCVAGDFAYPGYPSIGERLFRRPTSGASAVWAATVLSSNRHARTLSHGFYQSLAAGEGNRLGDAVLGALTRYEMLGGPEYIAQGYALLGDPAMRIR